MRALARSPRRPVALERDLEHHGSTDACDLCEQRRRVGHVLEHVREHAEREGVLGERQRRAVIALDAGELRALPRDPHCSLGDLDACERAAEVAAVQLAQQLAVGPRPREMSAATKVALACLAGYTALSFLSIAWAVVPGDAWEGANRTLLYLLVFALFACRRQRGPSGALLLGIWVLALIGLA